MSTPSDDLFDSKDGGGGWRRESFAMVTALALRELWFSPLPKNHTSKFQFDLERTDTNEVLRTPQCFVGEKKITTVQLTIIGPIA